MSLIKYTNFRIASLVGPEYQERVVNKMINFAKKNNCIKIRNGKQQFGYVHVADISRAIVNFIEKDYKHWEKVYNIGSNETDLTLLDIAKRIQCKLNKNGYSVSIEVQDSEKKTLLNSSKFNNLTEWEQTISIDDFIDEMIANVEIEK